MDPSRNDEVFLLYLIVLRVMVKTMAHARFNLRPSTPADERTLMLLPASSGMRGATIRLFPTREQPARRNCCVGAPHVL